MNTRIGQTPLYFGGMILSSIDAAYRYEDMLSATLLHRYQRIVSKYGYSFLGRAQDVFKRKLKAGHYNQGDLHPLPEDPLVHFDEMASYWTFLRLTSRKLNIVILEVFKEKRRGKLW